MKFKMNYGKIIPYIQQYFSGMTIYLLFTFDKHKSSVRKVG